MDCPGQPATVWVVVLNWNGLSDTLACLGSLGGQHYASWHVVVVDNGSRGPEAETLEASGLASRVISSPHNLGFAGGSNVGIRHALQNGADYIWLLNNDTIVDPECLTTLVAAGDADERVGLLSPVIYDHAAPHTLKFAGTVVDFDRQERVHLTSVDDMTRTAEGAPLALWGTALLIKRAVVERIGLLDERYFAYTEDMDYSVRALNAGFGTKVVPGAVVYHKEGASLGGVHSPLRAYLAVRNAYLFWSTHLKGRKRLGFRARYASWVLERALSARASPDVVDETLSGAWDALCGRWGPWPQRRPLPRHVKNFVNRWILGWHPYFWIRVLGGDVRGVAGEALGRLFRRRK
jgi:GT2 family glycosyltransferase